MSPAWLSALAFSFVSLPVAASEEKPRMSAKLQQMERTQTSRRVSIVAPTVDVVVQFKAALDAGDGAPVQLIPKGFARRYKGTNFSALEGLPMASMTVPVSELERLSKDPAVRFVSADSVVERNSFASKMTSRHPKTLGDFSYTGYDVDIALVDFQMPLQDGLSVISELRTLSPRTRCLLWTATLTPPLRARAQLLEVDTVIEKPIDDMKAFLQLL